MSGKNSDLKALQRVLRKHAFVSALVAVIFCLLSFRTWAETESGLAQLRLAIDVAIGDPLATSASQCKVIGLGVKPCGGPREFLVYSVEVTQDQTLRDLVTQYNRCDEQRNKRLELMSDCAYIEQPQSIFEDGRCVVK